VPLEDCSSPLGAPRRLIASSRLPLEATRNWRNACRELIASSRLPLEAKRNWRNACRNSRHSILLWTQNSLYIIIDHDRSLCIISLCHTKWPETKYHLNADLFGSVILRLRVLRRGCSPEEPVGPEFRLSCMIFGSSSSDSPEHILTCLQRKRALTKKLFSSALAMEDRQVSGRSAGATN